jgi:hypothetical protein
VTATVSHPAFVAHLPAFSEVTGEDPRLALVAEVDAHEGPVYFADENALYFTSLPRPGVDRSPSVQIKRLSLDDPGEISVLVADATAANGMAADRPGAPDRLRAGKPLPPRRHQPDRPKHRRTRADRPDVAGTSAQFAQRRDRRTR